MKNLFLTLTIGLTAMACSRLEKGDIEIERTYYGTIEHSFCSGYIFNFSRTLNPNIEKYLEGYAQWNAPNDALGKEKFLLFGETFKIKFKYSSKNNNPTVCPGFYGYDYTINIIDIEKIK